MEALDRYFSPPPRLPSAALLETDIGCSRAPLEIPVAFFLPRAVIGPQIEIGIGR